jgi:endonuclease-3
MYPENRTDLIWFTPFQLLVSVILSAQTTDKQVNKVMVPLYESGFSHPSDIIKW